MIYKLTLDAEKDLAEIYRYSYTQFGMSQADAYFDALEKHFTAMTRHPDMGTDFSSIRPNVRRSLCQSHAVYYCKKEQHILILRVLHQSRDPGRWLNL